jgi:hypothetical protein
MDETGQAHSHGLYGALKPREIEDGRGLGPKYHVVIPTFLVHHGGGIFKDSVQYLNECSSRSSFQRHRGPLSCYLILFFLGNTEWL